MNPARVLCVVLAFAVPALAAGQSITIPPLPLPPPAVHPATISLNVTVTDRSGQPVTGLRQSDFTVLDNGKPVAMQSFAEHSVAHDPLSVVIVIDAVNVGFVGSSLAVAQTRAFLQHQSEPLPFPVGIMLLTDSGLTPLGQASSDGKLLLAQLSNQGGHLRNLQRSAGFWGAEERAEISLDAMARLTRSLSTQPGRKLLIWVSPGWPIFDSPGMMMSAREQHVLFTAAVRLSEDLREGQITLCDVDPLGLWDADSFRTIAWKGYTRPLQRWYKAMPADLALQVIAGQSGGLVLNSSNDVAGEVKACAQANSAWYTIQLAPQTSEKPDTWRSVKVKLDKPGLTVRTRAGYYAQP